MSSFFNMDSPIMRFLSRICDLMILNILCIICCLPVVTAGASITALYTITLKMVRGEESYIFKGFLKAFKENFKTVYHSVADYGCFGTVYFCRLPCSFFSA